MGLKSLVVSFCLIWVGIGFIFLGLNAFISFNLSPGSTQYYIGMLLISMGLFSVVIGACYVIKELT